jgi:hypothetical protein
MTTARSTLLLGALAVFGFVLVLLIRSAGSSPPALAASAPVTPPGVARHKERVAPDPAPLAATAPANVTEPPKSVDAEAANAVGQALGSIHFEKKPLERDTKGQSIDINVQSALGVWQPDGRVMRVLLLESSPATDHVRQMLGAMQSGETKGVAQRSAVLELRFVPTAQAFDRSELDSATLIVSDGNLASSADALNSLDWHGSLPMPGSSSSSGPMPTFTLNTSSETVSSARETWKQSWRLSLTVPVVMR